ncbi:diaminopimelate decarboxylase [Leucobacter aridicollis]|uniref:diaminopimelate decarboxylase n=1 Tax=Leucobacter aridicollis TaxID=283878 RepID=UPI0021048D94|nr:diaminopimelate decarboxylase [Leucobacter aridicollis]UTX53240.1 diaminopimelate decarboxylase [Leucobacter aridicollis]
MNDSARRSQILTAARAQGLLHEEHSPLVAFLDWERVQLNVEHLLGAFPRDIPVLHAFAVKANPLVPVLARLGELGMGAEVASDGELSAALAAGITPDKLVFDSPAKSWGELRRALGLGAALNVDNFQELARVRALLADAGSDSEIGIRLNPQVGAGSIAAMSTASAHSKFGVPLRDPGMREQLIEAYLASPWLRRAHTHVGSQGCPLELIAEGVNELVRFADEVNARAGHAQIRTLDIGGGLPVDFATDNPLSAFDDYVAALEEGAPRLFSGDYEIVTEFGRSILAKHGFIATYVEYTKQVGGRRVAITHAGAQVATRTVFMPDAWPLRVEGFDSAGGSKPTAITEVQDVAGPCCFAGDLVARGRELPLLEPGDLVALLDTGAYYASNPFHYNSLPVPPVYGIENAGTAPEFTEIRGAVRHELQVVR